VQRGDGPGDGWIIVGCALVVGEQVYFLLRASASPADAAIGAVACGLALWLLVVAMRGRIG